MKTFFFVFCIFFLSKTLLSQFLLEHKFSNITSDRIDYLMSEAENYYAKQQLDSAVFLYQEAFYLAQKSKLDEKRSLILKEIGIIYEIQGNYSKALEYLFAALNISTVKKFTDIEAAININIGIVYFNLKKTDKAIEYYNRAVILSEHINDTVLLIKAYNNLGNVYMSIWQDWDKAEKYFNRSVELSGMIGFEEAIVVGLNNLCQVYMNSDRIEKAFEVNAQMIEIVPENPFVFYNLGNLYRQNNDNVKALESFDKSLMLSTNHKELTQILLNDIAEIYVEIGEFEKAIAYYEKYYLLNDSIHSLEQLRQSEEIEAKYQNLKKEKEIAELNNQSLKNERTKNIMTLLSIIMGLLAFILIILIRSWKKTTDQKLNRVENEKALIAILATLEGEEKERKRLATELHDGLGGMLSAIKLALNENCIKGSNKERILQDLLQNSILELRRISNALLPETLLNYGLKPALETYCNSFISYGSNLVLQFSNYGSEKRFGKQFELNVYRISQELVNNAVKHANATEINIQLIIDENRLFLSITDNGKGFDSNNIISNGLGMKSIKHRTEIYGGRFEINSTIDKGTEAIIEFDNLNNNSIVYDKAFNN